MAFPPLVNLQRMRPGNNNVEIFVGQPQVLSEIQPDLLIGVDNETADLLARALLLLTPVFNELLHFVVPIAFGYQHDAGLVLLEQRQPGLSQKQRDVGFVQPGQQVVEEVFLMHPANYVHPLLVEEEVAHVPHPVIIHEIGIGLIGFQIIKLGGE